MTKKEAEAYVVDHKNPAYRMEVVRILPLAADPILPGDTGWDVKITVIGDDS